MQQYRRTLYFSSKILILVFIKNVKGRQQKLIPCRGTRKLEIIYQLRGAKTLKSPIGETMNQMQHIKESFSSVVTCVNIYKAFYGVHPDPPVTFYYVHVGTVKL